MKVQRLFLGCSLSSHPLKGVGVPAQVISRIFRQVFENVAI
jgi:hypothetical protein